MTSEDEEKREGSEGKGRQKDGKRVGENENEEGFTRRKERLLLSDLDSRNFVLKTTYDFFLSFFESPSPSLSIFVPPHIQGYRQKLNHWVKGVQR